MLGSRAAITCAIRLAWFRLDWLEEEPLEVNLDPPESEELELLIPVESPAEAPACWLEVRELED